MKMQAKNQAYHVVIVSKHYDSAATFATILFFADVTSLSHPSLLLLPPSPNKIGQIKSNRPYDWQKKVPFPHLCAAVCSSYMCALFREVGG